MIKKEIKEYKQGKDLIQRINILKKDNIKGKVCILEIDEYNNLKETIENQNQEIQELHDKIVKLETNTQTIKQLEKSYKETIETLNSNQHEIIEKMDKQHHETIKELNQEQTDYLKQIYDDFNNELKKYITVNQLQNTALKQILELGFIDLIRNKHKKIAKKQIKELKDETVYELVEKKE